MPAQPGGCHAERNTEIYSVESHSVPNILRSIDSRPLVRFDERAEVTVYIGQVFTTDVVSRLPLRPTLRIAGSATVWPLAVRAQRTMPLVGFLLQELAASAHARRCAACIYLTPRCTERRVESCDPIDRGTPPGPRF
jgi:hypothetical protein